MVSIGSAVGLTVSSPLPSCRPTDPRWFGYPHPARSPREWPRIPDLGVLGSHAEFTLHPRPPRAQVSGQYRSRLAGTMSGASRWSLSSSASSEPRTRAQPQGHCSLGRQTPCVLAVALPALERLVVVSHRRQIQRTPKRAQALGGWTCSRARSCGQVVSSPRQVVGATAPVETSAAVDTPGGIYRRSSE